MDSGANFSKNDNHSESIKKVERFKDLFLLKEEIVDTDNSVGSQKSLSYFKIPNYQRPYSWEVNKENSQVERFFLDIQ